MRVAVSGQPRPWQTAQSGSGTIASSGHLGTQTAQSSQVYGSMTNRPRNESVFVSAPVGQVKSHAPQPMQRSATTLKLTAAPRPDPALLALGY